MTNKKKKMKTSSKIIIGLVIGFVIAMICMTISICFGYAAAYNSSVDSYMVKLFGINIYSLSKSGTEYVGTTIGTNMGIICMVFMAVAVAIEECTRNIVRKKHNT